MSARLKPVPPALEPGSTGIAAGSAGAFESRLAAEIARKYPPAAKTPQKPVSPLWRRFAAIDDELAELRDLLRAAALHAQKQDTRIAYLESRLGAADESRYELAERLLPALRGHFGSKRTFSAADAFAKPAIRSACPAAGSAVELGKALTSCVGIVYEGHVLRDRKRGYRLEEANADERLKEAREAWSRRDANSEGVCATMTHDDLKAEREARSRTPGVPIGEPGYLLGSRSRQIVTEFGKKGETYLVYDSSEDVPKSGDALSNAAAIIGVVGGMEDAADEGPDE